MVSKQLVMPVVLAINQVGVGDAVAVGGAQELEVELGVHLVGRQLARAGHPAAHGDQRIPQPGDGGGDGVSATVDGDVGEFLWFAEGFAPAGDRLFGRLRHEERIVTLHVAVPSGHREHRRPKWWPALDLHAL